MTFEDALSSGSDVYHYIVIRKLPDSIVIIKW
jgi:hypothetical protein